MEYRPVRVERKLFELVGDYLADKLPELAQKYLKAPKVVNVESLPRVWKGLSIELESAMQSMSEEKQREISDKIGQINKYSNYVMKFFQLMMPDDNELRILSANERNVFEADPVYSWMREINQKNIEFYGSALKLILDRQMNSAKYSAAYEKMLEDKILQGRLQDIKSQILQEIKSE